MTVKMLLREDLRSFSRKIILIFSLSVFCSYSRCKHVVSKAFESWNDSEYNRRLHQAKLLIDVPDNYAPTKEPRSGCK